MTLKQMREKRAANAKAMRAILDKATAENRVELSEEESAEYDKLKAECDQLTSAIARHEEMDGLESDLGATRPAAASQQTTESPGAGGVRKLGPEAKKEFETFGEFMHAVRFNQNDQRLHFQEFDGDREVATMEFGEDGAPRSEMRMDTGAAGGFMIPEQHRNEILRVDPATAIVRPRANVIPAGSPPDAAITMPALDQSGSAPGNMFGGVQVEWIAEGEEKPETDARFKEIRLEPKEVAGHIVVTDKLLRNWRAAGPFLERLLRDAISQSEDFAFISGNGVGKPLGYLNSGAALAYNRDTNNQIKYVDLVGMLAKILMRGGSPVWIASQSIIPQIMNMKDDDGRLIYVVNAKEGMGRTLLGYPLIINNRAAGLGSKGDISLADFSHYLIKDGSGPFVAASEHVHFKQNKTVIKAFWNVDGQPWLHAPVTEENGYTVSPFMVLDVPAG